MLLKATMTVLLAIAVAASSFAQQIVISGSVYYEGDGSAIGHTSIVIEDPENNKVLGFGTTSEDGRFSISLTTDRRSLQLVVTGFNIERKTVKIETRSQEISLEVKYKEMSLTEARIKTNPIKSGGDTTSYYVSMFADSLDRSIGDVLKKMPGLSVDKGGAIRYQGVLIDNFYVEGLDMMGSRYGVATNNIRAKDVASVEVYENHQPIKILQSARGDLEGSGKVAVNLKLKQNSKGAFIGSVQAGVGYEPLMWEGEFVSMLFTEKYQTLTTLKSNNSGRDIISELKEQYDGLKWMSPVFGVYSPQTPELDIERYMDNTTHAASLNNLFKIGSDKLLSINGIYIHDSQSFEDSSISKYYIPSSSPIEIKESTSKNQKTDNAEVRIKYTDNSDSHFITEVFSAGMEWNRSEGEVIIPSAAITQDFKMAANKSISNYFDFISRSGDNIRFGVEADFGYKELPATLTITPAILPELFGYDQIANSNAVQTYSSSGINAGILPNITMNLPHGWILSAKAGATINAQRMCSMLSLEDTGKIEDRFRNDNNYLRWDITSGLLLLYKRNPIQVNFSLDVNYATLYLTDIVRKRDESKSGLFINPNIFMMYSISPKFKMELLSYYKEDFAAFGDDYAGYIMTDYRRISSKDGSLAENRTHGHNLTMKYSNALSGFFASSDFQYWGRWSNIIYGTKFIGNLSDIQSYSVDNNSNGYSLEGKVSQYFDVISTTFDLSVGFNQYWMMVMRQGDLIDTDTRSPSLRFACIGNLGKKVKARFDIDYTHFQTKYDSISTSSPIDALHQKLSFDYQVFPGVIVNLSGEHYYNSAVVSTIRHITFLDSSILYRTKKYDIILEARNLLNTKNYSYSLTSDATEFESDYLLRQRAVFLKVKFNIN